LTYMANSLLMLYLPLWQLWLCMGLAKDSLPSLNAGPINIPGLDEHDHDGKIVNQLHDDVFSNDTLVDEDYTSADVERPKPKKYYSHLDIIKIAAIICPMWFMSNLLYNYSLLLTSVSSSTIIRYVVVQLKLWLEKCRA
jgi:hypothetical protein